MAGWNERTDRPPELELAAETAETVTIAGLEAKNVIIRILGDVAIIHARTVYTAGGEPKSGRYTDVWARQNGKWLAVSAHVTRG